MLVQEGQVTFRVESVPLAHHRPFCATHLQDGLLKGTVGRHDFLGRTALVVLNLSKRCQGAKQRQQDERRQQGAWGNGVSDHGFGQ